MISHRIGTREEWLAASAGLLQTERGARTLPELFDGRSQPVVYHFMFGGQPMSWLRHHDEYDRQ